MANDKNFKIKNGLSAKRYLQSSGVDTAGTNGPFGVFSTTLYEGNGSSQTINNGIDLAGEGGLVWVRPRISSDHWLWDSARGTQYSLATNNMIAQTDMSPNGTVFNTNGFTDRMGWGSGTNVVSWTFRKAPKFFDVVTYTGNGVAGRTISHDLGTTVGTIIVKRTDATREWGIYHRSLGGTDYLVFDTDAARSAVGFWNNTNPTSTEFTVGVSNTTNASGATYVAYLFAHDTASDSNIKCGSYTTDANEDATVTLGWKPSWLLVKRSDSSIGGDWRIIDSVRGVTAAGDAAYLEANTSDAEAQTGDGRYTFTDTGFTQDNFGASRTYIYIAIRAVVPTKTLDLSTGHTFSFTPSEATDILFSNPPASGSATGFSVEINNSGGYALTWPSSIKWHLGTAPTATASKELYTFVTTDGGTTYYGKLAAGDIA